MQSETQSEYEIEHHRPSFYKIKAYILLDYAFDISFRKSILWNYHIKGKKRALGELTFFEVCYSKISTVIRSNYVYSRGKYKKMEFPCQKFRALDPRYRLVKRTLSASPLLHVLAIKRVL